MFVVLCLGGGIAAGMNSAAGEDYRVGEAGRAEAMADRGRRSGPRADRTGADLAPRPGPLDRPAAAGAAVKDVTARLETLPEVEWVAAPVRSADGRMLRVEVDPEGATTQDGKKNVVAAPGADREGAEGASRTW